MKVIIPMAGAGTRLRPLTYTQPKPLIPLAGKPIVGHIIDRLVEHDDYEYVFVIGYLGEKLKRYIENDYPTLDKTFVVQSSTEGVGHAIWTAYDEISFSEELMIVLGDVIFDMNLDEFLSQSGSSLATATVEDPREFGVVERNNGSVVKVVEKPRIPKSNEALVGVYKVRETRLLFDCLNELVQNDTRTWGEIQLSDALMCMIERGAELTTYPVDNWYDCGKSDVLLQTNAILLDQQRPDYPPELGNNNIIIPPVYIGANCNLKHCIIGPHVTVGDHSQLESVIIKNSILGSYSGLSDMQLKDSIIGNDTSVTGYPQKFNLGDNTVIDLS